MARFHASATLAFVLAVTAACAAMAQEITESDVIACTRIDAAMAFVEAMKEGNQAAMGWYLSEEICSRFASISYHPMRIIELDTAENGPHIVHSKVFHLMELFVISDRSVPGTMAR